MKRDYNEELKEALRDRDEFFEAMSDEVYNHSDYDDEELLRYNRFIDTYNNLSQFERDVYYLRLKMSVCAIAKLYTISDTYIYRVVKQIKNKLNII